MLTARRSAPPSHLVEATLLGALITPSCGFQSSERNQDCEGNSMYKVGFARGMRVAYIPGV
jgi:hypothetical protein